MAIQASITRSTGNSMSGPAGLSFNFDWWQVSYTEEGSAPHTNQHVIGTRCDLGKGPIYGQSVTTSVVWAADYSLAIASGGLPSTYAQGDAPYVAGYSDGIGDRVKIFCPWFEPGTISINTSDITTMSPHLLKYHFLSSDAGKTYWYGNLELYQTGLDNGWYTDGGVGTFNGFRRPSFAVDIASGSDLPPWVDSPRSLILGVEDRINDTQSGFPASPGERYTKRLGISSGIDPVSGWEVIPSDLNNPKSSRSIAGEKCMSVVHNATGNHLGWSSSESQTAFVHSGVAYYTPTVFVSSLDATRSAAGRESYSHIYMPTCYGSGGTNNWRIMVCIIGKPLTGSDMVQIYAEQYPITSNPNVLVWSAAIVPGGGGGSLDTTATLDFSGLAPETTSVRLWFALPTGGPYVIEYAAYMFPTKMPGYNPMQSCAWPAVAPGYARRVPLV